MMAGRVLLTAISGMAIVLAGATFAEAAGNVARGRVIARDNCGACHAIGRTDASRNPKSPPFRTLGQRYPLRDLEESLADGIVVGHEGQEMPAFEFRPGGVADLIAYLTSIQPRRRK